jgi:PPOX class probable F420-dependent enzyme
MMTQTEIDEFLNLGLVGALATLRADGSPHVVPIWYRWDGAAITIWSGPTIGWVKRLRDDPRVAFTVYEHGVPSRAVYIRGTATLHEAPMAELRDELRAITARYVPAERLDAQLAEYEHDGNAVIVTIVPSTVRGEVN